MARILIVGLLACTSAVYAQLSEDDKINLVNFHNDLRSKIALGKYEGGGGTMPAAMNMRKLKWSDSLAAQAHAYSAKCAFKHSYPEGVGENLWAIGGSEPMSIEGTGLTASKSWASEYQEFNWQSVLMNEALFKTGIGHASQMTWAETDLIGCGASLCNENTKVFVVCHYKKHGNVLTMNIYEPGTTCSKCPEGSTCEPVTGLCA